MAPEVITMPQPTHRTAAHRQALRTVGRIAFTLSAMGCIEGAPNADDATPTDNERDATLDASWETPEPDSEPAADSGLSRDALIAWVAEDARVDVSVQSDAMPDDMGDAIDVGTIEAADALVDASDTRARCPTAAEDHEAWAACCEAIGWDWSRDPACGAWGPPMPPAMPPAMPGLDPMEVV